MFNIIKMLLIFRGGGEKGIFANDGNFMLKFKQIQQEMKGWFQNLELIRNYLNTHIVLVQKKVTKRPMKHQNF